MKVNSFSVATLSLVTKLKHRICELALMQSFFKLFEVILKYRYHGSQPPPSHPPCPPVTDIQILLMRPECFHWSLQPVELHAIIFRDRGLFGSFIFCFMSQQQNLFGQLWARLIKKVFIKSIYGAYFCATPPWMGC